jgi:UDP-N-acetylglucosamine 2-epimerase (non-hydrolysing)
MFVFGTRPEAVKLAPIILAARDDADVSTTVVVTGQHRTLLDQVLDVFGIVPDEDLQLLRAGQTLTDVTSGVLEGMAPILAQRHPDLVVVQGDTTSSFAAALAAFYAGIEVAHVEAGLRTFDRWSPYPEEMNRRLTTQLAALHLAPTEHAQTNLRNEGVDDSAIVVTGNTVIDALQMIAARRHAFDSPQLKDLDATDQQVLLVTAHRRESWVEGMSEIGRALHQIATSLPHLVVVFPIHPNAVVRDAITPHVKDDLNVRLVEPVTYPELVHLLARSTLVLTDSGGIQEEAPSLGKPVLVMRELTERPEGVASGNAELVGTDVTKIVDRAVTLLTDPGAYAAMATARNPYGDGTAAARSLAAMKHYLQSGSA